MHLYSADIFWPGYFKINIYKLTAKFYDKN
jgi:hypothetical protein